MSVDKQKRKKFQERMLRNEMLSIGSSFHTKAMQWLNETRKLYTEDSAELQNHPNSILSELKRINHERTYIAYKITDLAKDKVLTPSNKLKRKLRKLEMEIKFQEEFPEEYKKFMENLKKCLRQKPYSLNKRMKKNKNGNLKNIPYCPNMRSGKPNTGTKGAKSYHNSPKNFKTMKMIHGHGKSSQNLNGYHKYPKFTKTNLEKLLNTGISEAQFKKWRFKNKQQKKHGHAKRVCNNCS